MPPNITTSVNSEQNVRNRKENLIEKEKISKDASKSLKEKKEETKKPQSIVSKIINFIFIVSIVLVVAVAFFIFFPWEDYLFDEEEIENYINMYAENQDGDWVVRQFLATSDQNITEPILHETECYQKGYKMEAQFNAAPETCGIVITDSLMEKDEIARIRHLAQKITEEIGLQSYANRESLNLKWMNLHKLFRMVRDKKYSMKNKDYELIKKASEAAKHVIADAFGLPVEQLHFYLVTQFTRYRTVVPFSEFRHVDKVRSPALVVTSILWLSTTDVDFGGGRTEFLVGGPEPFTPLLIEPKTGRFAAWTSGWENPHGVMDVNWGDRLALIFAFTVNPKMGYKDLDSLRQYSESASDIQY